MNSYINSYSLSKVVKNGRLIDFQETKLETDQHRKVLNITNNNNGIITKKDIKLNSKNIDKQIIDILKNNSNVNKTKSKGKGKLNKTKSKDKRKINKTKSKGKGKSKLNKTNKKKK